MIKTNTIAPQTGVGFCLREGERLRVISPTGAQVADLFCFSENRPYDALSSGRSIDYNETVYLTVGHTLYSNQGVPLLQIIEDQGGRHDFLVTPCSLQMFQMLSGNQDYHRSCHENLCKAFTPFDRPTELITTTFNIFMNYRLDLQGRIQLGRPRCEAGTEIVFEACEDIVVGLTACADPATNDGQCKAIEYVIENASNQARALQMKLRPDH